MPALLSYGEQAFWVSNGTKDLLYEVVLEMARRDNPSAHERLREDTRFGYYGVSGMGFELEAFVDCFQGKAGFKKTVTAHAEVVDEFCDSREECVRLMRKLFDWIWFLLDDGRCNAPSGEHPDLDDMPQVPG